MEKIITIALSSLTNDMHLQLMNECIRRLDKDETGELGVSEQTEELKEAVAIETDTMRTEVGHALSTEIVRLDKLRDNTLLAIDRRIDSAVHSPIAEEAASGLVLQRVFNKYGDVRDWEYNSETNAINLFVADLLLPENALHLQTIGIAAWIPQLKAQNDEFVAVYGKRNFDLANRTSGDTKTARRPVDIAYRKIVDTINATIQLNIAKPAAIAFVKEWNELLLRYKTIIAQHRGSAGKNAETNE